MMEMKTTEVIEEAEIIPCNCEKIKNCLIFDTLAVQFRVAIFWKQLISHLIIPLYPFLTENILPWYKSLYLNGFYPCVLYLMIASYWSCSDHDKSLIKVAGWIPFMLFAQHRITIALKYASLSSTEYNRFMMNKSLSVRNAYQTQMQLFTGWMELDENTMYFELSSASARIGVNIAQMDIVINGPSKTCKSQESQLKYWNAFLRGHTVIEESSKLARELKKQPNGNYHVSVFDVTQAIIRHAASPIDQRRKRFIAFSIIYVFVVLNLAIPFICLWQDLNNNHVDNWYLMATFYITSTLLNWRFGFLVYILLYIAIVDVVRQHHMVSQLHCMLRLTDLMMHAELSLGVERTTQKSYDSAKSRLDAIMYIQEYNNREINLSRARERKSSLGAAYIEGGTYSNGHGDVKSPFAVNSPDYMQDLENQKYKLGDEDLEGGNEDENVEDDKYARRCSIIGEQIARDTYFAVTPRLNLAHPQNIIGWAYCRLVVQNFGERFRVRLNTYVGELCSCCYCFCFICFLAITLALLVAMMIVNLEFVITASNRLEAFQSPFFRQCFFTVTMGIAFLAVIFYVGSLVNDELALHSRTIAGHKLKTQYKIREIRAAREVITDPEEIQASKEEEEKYNEIFESIDAAADIIDVNTELKPFKILGLTAQSALTMSILTTALSFYSIVISLYFGTQNSSLSVV